MEYKILGKSELNISRIGFGCMSLKNDDNQNDRIIGKAVDYGINYFDTADIYNNGMNEMWIGKALRSHRKKIIIATKVGNQLKPGGQGLDWNPSKEHILKSVDQSLKRLQTDYIDLYQLHGGTINDPIDETIEAFELLVQQGKIRYYGISSIRPNVIREWVKRSNIVSVMMQYSLLDRRPEEESLSLLLENKIGVLARGSVASGLLIDKEPKQFLDYTPKEVEAAANAIKNFSKENKNAAQTAIQFVFNNPAITAAIIGIRTPEQLDDALGTVKAHNITPAEMEELQHAIPVNFYKEHR